MDLYEALGLRRNASAAEVRRAYQKRARQLHPDLNPGDPVAAERFREVSRAFEVLSDPHRRAQYDRGEAPASAPAVPDVGFEGFDFSAEVRIDGAGFHDIFEGVLQAGRRPGGDETRGEDLEQTTSVSFEECFQGTRRRVHVVRQDRCPVCDGRGELSLRPRPCPICQGAGQVRKSRGRMIFTRRCTECGATGVVGHQTCSRCSGEGRIMQSEWLEVQIPPGVDDGSRVRLAGWGNAGRRGGPSGDFILVVQVQPHPFYRREGSDLHCLVPVTITEAALGAHVEVPTPDGAVRIELPAGTQAGQRFRLRKRGLPKLQAAEPAPARDRARGERGDLWVEVQVRVPVVSDDQSRALLEEFARRNPEDPRKDLPHAEGKA
jgi:molecular chaperone DnaJ